MNFDPELLNGIYRNGQNSCTSLYFEGTIFFIVLFYLICACQGCFPNESQTSSGDIGRLLFTLYRRLRRNAWETTVIMRLL